jgi:sRNA-binding regulator protein Hfq
VPTIKQLWDCGNPLSSVTGGASMKDAINAIPMERSAEQEGFSNRRLIRPSLSRPEHGHNHNQASMERRDRPERLERPSGGKKMAPPETTNAENFYYQKQMQGKTPMVVVLRDGEEIHGVIEWYDRSCIKLNRNGAPNLMIYKPSIKYMYKEGENEK